MRARHLDLMSLHLTIRLKGHVVFSHLTQQIVVGAIMIMDEVV